MQIVTRFFLLILLLADYVFARMRTNPNPGSPRTLILPPTFINFTYFQNNKSWLTKRPDVSPSKLAHDDSNRKGNQGKWVKEHIGSGFEP